LCAPQGGERLKVGAAPSTDAVSYLIGSEVFEKRADIDPSAPYADRGAAVQVYVGDEFCELETLGPVRDVEPGGSVSHTERWTLRPADPAERR
jgi:hypothetical protein